MRLALIAEHIGGTLIGDGDVEITGVAGIREAGASDLTFLANPRYHQYLATTVAGGVVVGPDAGPCGRPLIRTPNPYLAYVHAMRLLCGNGNGRPAPGVHPSAVVAETAVLGPGVCVGPHAVIGDGAVLGEGTLVGALAFIGRGATLGPECVLHPGAILREECVLGARVVLESGAVVGGDGFGYVWDGSRHLKIPHVGRVVLEDEVEVGSNATVDRGTTGETRVRRGTKIDNLVQIAHNVQIGEHALLAAQVGVSGSTEVGSRAVLAGQVGVTGHLQIGDGAFVGAKSGLDKNVPAGQNWWGSPAKERSRVLRERAALTRLPELLKHVRSLEARIEELERNRKP